MKIKTKKVIKREDIKREPTKDEVNAIKQFGQDINNKCLDCGKPLYYFNQCDDCRDDMISGAKAIG